MIEFKKVLRTFQTNFPYLLETKFHLMRLYRNQFKIPFEKDFNALSLFPESENFVFLDVGANRGQSTDAILMTTHKGQIHMFEPNPWMCDCIEKLYGNHPRVKIHKFGLGNTATEELLYVPFYKKWMFDGLASFNYQEASEWLKNRMYNYQEELLTIEQFKCHIRQLDELKLAPFFIKIDVQGYEFQALQGGETTIRTHQPVLLIESPSKRIIDYLKSFGYQIYAFKRGKFIPTFKNSLNAFFMTESKASLVEAYIEHPNPSSSSESQLLMPS
ncbi:FkbM family methyltransferase [Geitlerinema splendidum]|nr:FkbM family methyltransferase [Geitlerinema splendidum]